MQTALARARHAPGRRPGCCGSGPGHARRPGADPADRRVHRPLPGLPGRVCTWSRRRRSVRGHCAAADIDVLVSYLVVNQPDLTAGPVIEHRDRALLVGCGHRLAGARSVSVEDLGDEEAHQNAPGFPPELYDAIVRPGHPVRQADPGAPTLER